jgi:hypothetical protein
MTRTGPSSADLKSRRIAARDDAILTLHSCWPFHRERQTTVIEFAIPAQEIGFTRIGPQYGDQPNR